MGEGRASTERYSRPQAFERAVLALAALLCEEDIPCQQCRYVAADKISESWRTP